MYEHNTIRQIGTSCSSNNIFLMILEQRVQPMYNIGMKLTLKYKDPAYVHSLPCVCTCEVIGSLYSETNSMQQQTNKQKNVLKTLRPLVESLWTINLDFVSKQMIHEEQRKHYLAQNIETLKCNSESVKCKSKIEIWNNATLWLSPNQQHEFVKKM